MGMLHQNCHREKDNGRYEYEKADCSVEGLLIVTIAADAKGK